MLIEFSVSNFLSFREKQTFSMIAAPRLRKKENVFKVNVRGEKLPDLLKVAAIYGPNASGKSNFLKALELVPKLSKRKPSAQNKPIPVAPFRFDSLLANQPSRFEVHFIYQGQRYEFDLATTAERIIEERLISYPYGKETLLYERIHASSGDTYTFGESLEGGQEVHEAWKRLTAPQSLFISQAVANSSDELQQLRLPFTWLQNGIVVVDANVDIWAMASQRMAKDHPQFAKEIATFLREVDVPVSEMQFDTVSGTAAEADLDEEDAATAVMEKITIGKDVKTTLTHKSALGEAKFDFTEESKGTQNLVGFWLPWRLKSTAPNQLVGTLGVDELDSSLHPEIVASLVAKHLKLEEPAQLIFTTHDTHLMDTKLMRRDQFWITERDMNGATQLRSIHDFEGRESEDIEKRYYEGRYRGLPFLRRN